MAQDGETQKIRSARVYHDGPCRERTYNFVPPYAAPHLIAHDLLAFSFLHWLRTSMHIAVYRVLVRDGVWVG